MEESRIQGIAAVALAAIRRLHFADVDPELDALGVRRNDSRVEVGGLKSVAITRRECIAA